MYDISEKEKSKEEEKLERMSKKIEAKLFTTSLSISIQNKELSLVGCFMASMMKDYVVPF